MSAYRFKRRESVAEGVRRIAAGRLDDALEQLRGPGSSGGEERVEAIHEARKDLKKARSLLRLCRGALGDARYRAGNDRLRDAGRLLSATRDADVAGETLAKLRERYRDELETTVLAALEGEIERAASALTRPTAAEVRGAVAEATAAIEAARADVDTWELAADEWDALAPGLRRAYSRGRARLAEVAAGAGDELVHEWRKRAKDLWYHLRLLAPSWPQVLGATAEAAHDLSDLLGDHHDLSLIAAELARADSPAGAARDELAALVVRRQRELLGEAIPLGRRLYAERPKAYARRLGDLWRAWRA